MIRRLWEWLGMYVFGTRHKDCGGVWQLLGISGLAAPKIHWRCDRCYEEYSHLREW